MNKNHRHRLFRGWLLVSVAVLASAVLVTSQAAADPAPLSGWGTATIDGVIGSSEWAGAATQDLSVNLPDGDGTTAGRYYVMNDESNIYVGLRLERPSLDWGHVLADFSANDDNFFVRSDDFFMDDWLNYNDTQVGGTIDGSGSASNDGVYSYFEMAHPLDSADNAHDFSLALGDTVGFRLWVRVCGTVAPCADTYDPAYPVFRDVLIAHGSVDELFAALHSAVEGVGPGTSLADKVTDAQTAYNGNESGSCKILRAFVNQVEAQSGKHIDPAVAEQLIADATAIIEAIGC